MSTGKDTVLRIYTGYNIKRAFNALQLDLNTCLFPAGLRMVTFSVLNIIDDNPGIRQSAVAKILVIERPNMVVIIDELEQAGLITRERSEKDRRAYELHTTPHGKTRLKIARTSVAEHEDRMTQGLSDQDKDILNNLLQKIEANGLGRT